MNEPCKRTGLLNVMLKAIMIHKLFNQIMTRVNSVKLEFNFFNKFSMMIHVDRPILPDDTKLRLNVYPLRSIAPNFIPAFLKAVIHTPHLIPWPVFDPVRLGHT